MPFALLLSLALVAQPASPFPVWLQHQGAWSEDPIAGGGKGTVGQLGCAVTAVAMLLRGQGKTIGGKPVDPAVLNASLKDLHLWNMAAAAGMRVRVVSAQLDEALKRGPVILQIQYAAPPELGSGLAPHFVLSVGTDPSGRRIVHDPLKGRRLLDPKAPLDVIQQAFELY